MSISPYGRVSPFAVRSTRGEEPTDILSASDAMTLKSIRSFPLPLSSIHSLGSHWDGASAMQMPETVGSSALSVREWQRRIADSIARCSASAMFKVVAWLGRGSRDLAAARTEVGRHLPTAEMSICSTTGLNRKDLKGLDLVLQPGSAGSQGSGVPSHSSATGGRKRGVDTSTSRR